MNNSLTSSSARPGLSYRSPAPGSIEARSSGSTVISKGFKKPSRITRLNSTTVSAQNDLEAVYKDIGNVSQICEEDGSLSNFMARRSINLNNPKLGSIEEFQKDLWQAGAERFSNVRQKQSGLRLSLSDKRNLRRWFSALDADGSGEVTIEELEDPLISTGILKTKEEVLACMKDWDTDNSNTISFDEFVNALHDSKAVNRDRLELLREMSKNNAMTMETLIGFERRKSLHNYVVKRGQQRDAEVAEVWKREKKFHRQGMGRYAPEIAMAFKELEEKHRLAMEQDIECVRSVEDVFHQRCADMRRRGLFNVTSRADMVNKERSRQERLDKMSDEERRDEAWTKSFASYAGTSDTSMGWHDRYGLDQPLPPYAVYADRKDATPSRYVVPSQVKNYRKSNLTYKIR